MAQIKNDAQAIEVLESILAYLRKREFKESGRPAADLSSLGAIMVKGPTKINGGRVKED